MNSRQLQPAFKHLVDDFHQCTALMTAGFSAPGALTYSRGVHAELLDRLTNISREIVSGWERALDCPGVVLPEVGRFVGVSLCRRCLDRGYIIIGPFQDSKSSCPGARPAAVIPHLVRLVRLIQDRILTAGPADYRQQVSCLHVQRALNFIHQHFHESLTLGQTAHHLGINPSYLSSLVRSETGATFSQWVNRVRVERSKELLQHTEKSIAAIAMEVGYSNQSYFTNIFNKQVGAAPNAYRQRWRTCQEDGDRTGR